MDANEIYLKVWDTEQRHTKTRWTVYTFFASISFAIFGLSFQNKLNYPTPTIMRFSGMIIYWFAYLLFRRFFFYSLFLRNCMEKLSEATSLDIEHQKADFYKTEGFSKHLTTKRLLLFLGILYTIALVLLHLYKI